MMEKAKQIIDRILLGVCIVLFIAMVILTTYQVITRYFFNLPSTYSEVLTRYAFVWLILLSATYIFGQRDHIAINLLKDKFKGTAKTVINVLIEIITIIFAVTILIYGGFRVSSLNMLQMDSMLNIPTGYIYSVIFVSGILTVLYCIYNIIHIVSDAKKEEK